MLRMQSPKNQGKATATPTEIHTPGCCFQFDKLGCRLTHLRLQCDGRTPQCQKCTKSGSACPGYSNGPQLAIRDMTKITAAKVESRVQKVLKARREAEISSSESETSSPESALESILLFQYGLEHQKASQGYRCISRDSQEDFILCRSPSTDWKDVAVTRYFAEWASHSQAMQDVTGFLPRLCSGPESSATLQHALHAAAYANQAYRGGVGWMGLEAEKAYVRALASLKVALQDTKEAKKDSTLAAIHYLGQHEVSTVLEIQSMTLTRLMLGYS